MAENGRKSGVLVTALARGSSIRAAAKASEFSERTIYRKLESESFRQEVAKARAEMIGRATAVLAGSVGQAAAALRKLLRADNENVRRLTAVSIIDGLCKLRSASEFEERLAKLEQAILRGQKR